MRVLTISSGGLLSFRSRLPSGLRARGRGVGGRGSGRGGRVVAHGSGFAEVLRGGFELEVGPP